MLLSFMSPDQILLSKQQEINQLVNDMECLHLELQYLQRKSKGISLLELTGVMIILGLILLNLTIVIFSLIAF